MPIVGSFAGASARAYGAGAGGIQIGDFESIATTTVGAGGSSTITFSSIPATYTHLQIRIHCKATGVQTYAKINFNGDTATNYSWHDLTGNGTTAVSSSGVTQSFGIALDPVSASTETNIFALGVVDILDYANTNKYKTLKSLSGYDANGSGYAFFNSSNWRSTNAITSIVLTPNANNFAQYSSFALYGIKA